MAKRYYSSSKSERMGQDIGERNYSSRDRAGDPGRTDESMYIKRDEGYMRDRRHKSMYGLGMIDEDHSAVANLPQGVRMNSYEQTGPWMPTVLDDTIRGVDKQMDRDDSQRRTYMNPHKY